MKLPLWLARIFLATPAPTTAPAPFPWPDVADEERRLSLLWLARRFRHVRELAGNRGARVEGIQRWCGGVPGAPWCAYYVTMVLDLYYDGKAPFPREGSCNAILALAKDKGLIVTEPEPGDLYLRLKDPTDAVHVGFCTTPIRTEAHPTTGKPRQVFGQLSGNTSKDGLSNNGDRVAERDIPLPPAERIAFVRLPAKP